MERLRFLGPENIAFTTWSDSRALKIEAYCDERTARQLVNRFGGRVTKLAEHIWTGDPARPRGPLSIRGKLKIFSDKPSWREWRKAGRKPDGIFIPAGMAFGTGEHATTATCLRFLADICVKLARRLQRPGPRNGCRHPRRRRKGARRRPSRGDRLRSVAVRIAKQNASANGFRTIKISCRDVLKLAIRRPFDVVLANLFSDVLIAAAPRIAHATKPGGWLIFSGVLRKQVQEVVSALRAAGFSNPRIIVRGKWCAGTCQKNQRTAVESTD